MRPPESLPQVFLYRDPVDFRKSYRGLGAIVELEIGHNPFDGALYVFTNRRRNKIKCLFWEDNGFVLYYKCLAEDKFKWPKRGDDLMALTGQQINWLLDGYDISLMHPHKKLHYASLY
jgi:transposase